jgi:hypothetical protein
VLRRVTKQLTCPGCDDVVADVVYRPWSGSRTITWTEGHQITVSASRRLRDQDPSLPAPPAPPGPPAPPLPPG